ncbi:hypothetical protein EVAR_35890_1 [Eumeta japonica]|uniref:Uncharacterized protein n=1 Tax=Eumeta variegata TaxID=151549 RepID=A0A4C1WTC4_EUMVA|nr:hypothetical protein EVAR_35890_1 [Eumeta japonica]
MLVGEHLAFNVRGRAERDRHQTENKKAEFRRATAASRASIAISASASQCNPGGQYRLSYQLPVELLDRGLREHTSPQSSHSLPSSHAQSLRDGAVCGISSGAGRSAYSPLQALSESTCRDPSGGAHAVPPPPQPPPTRLYGNHREPRDSDSHLIRIADDIKNNITKDMKKPTVIISKRDPPSGGGSMHSGSGTVGPVEELPRAGHRDDSDQGRPQDVSGAAGQARRIAASR